MTRDEALRRIKTAWAAGDGQVGVLADELLRVHAEATAAARRAALEEAAMRLETHARNHRTWDDTRGLGAAIASALETVATEIRGDAEAKT